MTSSAPRSWPIRSLLPPSAGPSCAGIITQRYLERIDAMIQEARDAGARVMPLGGEADPADCR